jgi:hypothetical protein
MSRLIALSAAALFLATPVLAQSAAPLPAPAPAPAADAAKQALGVIVSIDAVAGTVTLASGDTFQVPAAVKTADLKVGSKVRIAFETNEMGLKVVTGIAAIVEGPDAPPTPARPNAAGAG